MDTRTEASGMKKTETLQKYLVSIVMRRCRHTEFLVGRGGNQLEGVLGFSPGGTAGVGASQHGAASSQLLLLMAAEER